MKYIGNFSPCWSIKHPEEYLSAKAHQILQENRDFANIVGPGKYDAVNLPLIKEKPKVFTFEKSIKFSDDKFVKLLSTSFKKQAQKNFDKIHETNKRNSSNRKESKVQRQNFSLGKRNLFENLKVGVPSPGAYDLANDIKKNQSPHVSFGYKSDNCVLINNKTPEELGPGVYMTEISSFKKGIKFSKSKRDLQPIEKQVESREKEICAIEKRKNSKNMRKSENSINVKLNPTFGKETRNAVYRNILLNLNPGPGQYMIHDEMSAVPGKFKPKAYSMAGKFMVQNESTSKIPGPSSYVANPKLFDRSKSYSFGKALKQQDFLKNVDKCSKIVQDKSEGDSKEEEELFIEEPKIAKFIKGGDISRALKLVQVIANVPGPGRYTPLIDFVKRKAPEIKIGSHSNVKMYKYLLNKENDGDIQLEPNFESVDKHKKFGRFGKGPRSPRHQIDPKIVGVNQQYDLRLKIGHNGFKFGNEQKLVAKVDDNSELGPGFYEIKNTMGQFQPWIKM